MDGWNELLAALALLLIIEGIMPFLSPDSFRQTMRTVSEMDDKVLRTIGFFSMILGIILLYWVH